MFWRGGLRVLKEGGRRGGVGREREERELSRSSPMASLREMMLWKASSS